MFSAFINCFKVKELRQRMLFTALIIILVRLAAAIPCPGVDPSALSKYLDLYKQSSESGVMGMLDIFSGGALLKFAIVTLGIMPYISASIIMQLLLPVFTGLEKLAREGEAGRQKINQYTRYLTLAICIVQGSFAALVMLNPQNAGLKKPIESLIYNGGVSTWMPHGMEKLPFIVMTVIILTCGTMIFMWLGEQITEKGIGNGISLIITVNILARMPSAFLSLIDALQSGELAGGRFGIVHFFILMVLFVLVTAATIVLTLGERRIPIQVARSGGAGGKIRASSTYMPLKVNFSGVMPIIFAGALMMAPSMIIPHIPFLRDYASLFAYGSPIHMAMYGLMILIFAFFWVQNQFKPLDIADNLKRQGAFIPGVKPGTPTADFLDSTMTRITVAGALFLMGLAIFPMIISTGMKVPYITASFFGGTSILIVVGVVLDTINKMESHLSMRNYDGFLSRGKVRSGRRSS